MPSCLRKSPKLLPWCWSCLVSFPILHAFECEFYVCGVGLPRLFDERMQQDHFRLFYGEQDACNAVSDGAAHFPNRPTQMVSPGFANRLFVLNIGNVFANAFPLLSINDV